MYEKQFYLKSRPFVSAPYAPHYFPARPIHQALAQLRLCIERANGIGVVTGQPGMGKSMLLVMLAEWVESQFKVVQLSCSRLEQRAELLQSILFELGEPFRDMSEGELRLGLLDYLRQSARIHQGVVLLVDDAHALSTELLEELNSINNVVREGLPRCRLVLAGNLALEEKLSDPRLESLNQRVAARCSLSSWNREETSDYVRAQMNRAGAGGRQFFSADAMVRLHQLTDGVPRLINLVCDHALVLCASSGSTKVEVRLIEQAWSDVQRLPLGVDLNLSTAGHSSASGETAENDAWATVEFGELPEDVPTTLDAELRANHPANYGAAENFSEEAELGLAAEDRETEVERHRQRQGYYWTLTGDHYQSVDGDSAASEIERLTREQEELVAQVESLARMAQNPDGDFSTTAAGLNIEPVVPAPKFIKNPFDEDFESEEPVLDTTIRYSLRHNRSATELTMLQLSTAECWTEEPFSLTESGVTPVAAAREPATWTPFANPVGNGGSPESSPALDMSPTTRPGVFRGQETGTSEDAWNPSKMVSSTTAWFTPEATTAHALPKTTQEQPRSGPTANPEVNFDEREAPESITLSIERKWSESSGSGPSSGDKPTDDRDLLIVSRVNQYPSPEETVDEEPPPAESKGPTGKAIRLDYRELFERLRNGGDEPSGADPRR